MSNEFPPRNANVMFGSHLLGVLREGADPSEIKTTSDKAAFKDLGDMSIKDLQKHLQAAVLLELKTIPPYLYAAFSIKVSGPAKWSILNVAQQEMLHLALAGNILSAIGGQPKLYSLSPPGSGNPPEFPSYPDKMFYQETPLNLRGATKPNIRTFLELEQPSLIKDQAEEALKAYGSLGTFYWAIGEALKFHSNKLGDQVLFVGKKEKQLQYGDGSWYNDEMVLVKDLKSALRALSTIIDQGEGTPRAVPVRPNGSLDPPAPFAVKSHFEIFQDVYKGPSLDHYNVLENPKTENFKDTHPEVYKVLLVGDAAYCYLLQTIETLWKTEDKVQRMHLVNNNLHNIMLKVLQPLATFLLSNKVHPMDPDPEAQRFSLFFNYYAFGSENKLTRLKTLMDNAVGEYPELSEVHKAVNALADVGN